MRSAMIRLAELHRHLAIVPSPSVDPLAWLRERLARVALNEPHALPEGYNVALSVIARLLEEVPSGPTQWLHGDYHLGNLLWHKDQVVSVVDFEDTACGSWQSEMLMALFALARQNEGEDNFAYDRALWDAGLRAYLGTAGEAVDGKDWPLPSAAEQLFCAYQVLVHLEAAQRGLWSLGPGIGFWPCWHRLMQAQ
jgi:aminoglycoside phosphotransferase (APT) family kinase protein